MADDDDGIDARQTADISHLRLERLRRARKKRAAEQSNLAARRHIAPYQMRDPTSLPQRDFLYGKSLIRGYVSMTASRGGIGKTAVLITDGLAMSSGRNLVGDEPKGKLRVLLITTEESKVEIDRRIAAACLHYGITETDIGGRLFVEAGPKAARIIADDDRDGIRVHTSIIEELIDEAVLNGIDVILIDPVIDTSTVNENDNTKIAALMRLWVEIAEDAEVAIGLCHHVRKPGAPDQVLSSDDARGAGTLVNKVRDSRVLNGMTAKEAELAGIDPAERRFYFRVHSDKRNLAPPDEATWRRIVNVPLPNGPNGDLGDQIGVVEAWTWKDSLFDEISTADLREVQQRIAAGRYRDNSQAKDWAGTVVADVLELDLADRDAKKAVNAVIKKWIQTKVLRRVTRADGVRHKRVFVEVGRWVN